MFDRFRSTTLALVVVASALGVASAQADSKVLACPIRWGEPGRPLVANAETARTIFLAVEKDFFPQADREAYPAVDVRDEGERWSVFRWRPPVSLPNGQLEVTHGGGQLTLAIAKCDATISDVYLSK